jgi:hypothetical protein
VISQSGRVIGVVASGLNSIERMKKGGYVPQSVNFAVKTVLVLPLLSRSEVELPVLSRRQKIGKSKLRERCNRFC